MLLLFASLAISRLIIGLRATSVRGAILRVATIRLSAAISVIVVNEMVPDVTVFALVVVSVVVRLDNSVIGHSIDDWGSKVQSA